MTGVGQRLSLALLALLLAVLASASRAAAAPPPGSPVAINGLLRVCGTQLCNKYGKPIQLRGMSTHGLQWYGDCINNQSLNVLARDWKADVIRISMYVQEDGYVTDPRGFTDMVHAIIEQATARGLYAIVDWHMLNPGDPFFNLSRAKVFFAEIAERHKAKVNVLYEVANEPSGVSWTRLRNYHHAIIPVIRDRDPNGIVLLGTRGWSSLGVSEGSTEAEVVANPVNATNVMYTFHIYAHSHGADYYNALSRAAAALPMFVTEFGTQNYLGEDPNNFPRSQRYVSLMAEKKISWVNWNYSDDWRPGAVFKEGTCAAGVVAGISQLKEAGVWIRNRIRSPDNFPVQ